MSGERRQGPFPATPPPRSGQPAPVEPNMREAVGRELPLFLTIVAALVAAVLA